VPSRNVRREIRFLLDLLMTPPSSRPIGCNYTATGKDEDVPFGNTNAAILDSREVAGTKLESVTHSTSFGESWALMDWRQHICRPWQESINPTQQCIEKNQLVRWPF